MAEHKKKRLREEDEANGVRKPKRSKSHVPHNGDANPGAQPAVEEDEAQLRNGEELKKKKKKRESIGEEDFAEVKSVKKKKSKKSKDEAEEVPVPDPSEKKRSKKDKSHLSEKKVVDSDEEQEQPKPEVEEPQEEPQEERPAKKHKKDKKKHSRDPIAHAMEIDAPEEPADDKAIKKQDKKAKKEKKRKQAEAAAKEDDGGIDLDEAQESSSEVEFPFYTQTVALYLPVYPAGFGQPITAACQQHLDPMLNHYSNTLGGVALAYRNVNVGEKPVPADLENPPTDDTIHAELRSIDEYAVGFGYITADFDMFKPRRGAWMEGRINLQTDGHIGLVCWDRFNASIEAKRLPPGWTWVDASEEAADGEDEDVDMETENNGDEEQEDGTAEKPNGTNRNIKIQSTGYWVDASGAKMTGAVRFRIQAFDAGTAGDHGYLSIRGTMLSEKAERALAAEEREADRQRRAKQNPFGVLRPASRRLPEASMTNFRPAGEDEEEKDETGKVTLYKGSLPQTPS